MHLDPIENKFILSQPQQRIWNIESIYPGTAIYNVGGVSLFDNGNIDLITLKKAFLLMLKKNKSFRLKLLEIEGEAWQYFDETSEFLLVDERDFSNHKFPQQTFNQWAADVFSTSFPMINSPLFYIAVVKITEKKVAFLLKFHHIIMDGWSVALSINEVYENYLTITQGCTQKETDTDDYQYKKFIEEENNYLNSSEFRKDKQFWLSRFGDFQYFSAKRTSKNLAGKRKEFVIKKSISESLATYVNDNSITLNIFFISVVLFFEQRKSGKSDLTIGVPLLNRNGKKNKKTTGMFTSTMPFRFNIEEELTVKELLSLVKQELKAFYQHQKYPYNYLIKDLELRKKEIDRLFGICVNCYSTHLPDSFQDATIDNREFYSGYQLFDFQLSIKEWGGTTGIQLQFDYNSEVYSDIEIDFIFETINYLAGEFCTNEQRKLKHIQLLTVSQKENINLYFNKKIALPAEPFILEYWRKHSHLSDSPFYFDEEGNRVTHGEFQVKAIQLASYLKEQNICKQERVCIIMTHSGEYITSILSVLLLGATFVPIDPQNPFERIKYIIEDTQATLVITDIIFYTSIEDRLKVRVLFFKEIEFKNTSVPFNFPDIEATDTAYIIYTSGTTGRPKGVTISHANLTNYCLWAAKTYCQSKENVFAFFTSIGFDLTITSIFVPLISGDAIKIFSHQREDIQHSIYSVFSSKDVNIIKATPSHLKLLKNFSEISRNSDIKLIIGGEDLRTDLAREIYSLYNGSIEIFNEYGPTEATVGCMIHKFNPATDGDISVPIGKPIDNTCIYLLDDELREVSMGTTGQIYVGGNSVSNGYWNNPEMNKKKFFQNILENPALFYKTGDLGKFIDSYNITYEGRVDDQVKINGNRVELKEIEAVIKSYHSIKDAHLATFSGGKDEVPTTAGKVLIIAYIIVNETYTEELLMDFLIEKLPHYMIPSSCLVLSEFPLNKNGKIDVENMPIPDNLSAKKIMSSAISDSAQILISAVMELLTLDKVDLFDSFFSIGGDSISAIQLSAKLRNMNLTLSVQDVLTNPVINEMSKRITSSLFQKRSGPPGQRDAEEDVNIHFTSPAVAWFYNLNFEVPQYYTQSTVLEVKVIINRSILNEVIQKLVFYHDSLRIQAFPEIKKIGYSIKLFHKRIEVKEYTLNNVESLESQFTYIGNTLRSSIKFDDDFLFKVALIKDDQQNNWILLIFHHIIIDAVSWQILLGDLQELFKQVKEKKPLMLEMPHCRWNKWAAHFMQLYTYPVTHIEKNKIELVESFLERTEKSKLLTENVPLSFGKTECRLEIGQSQVNIRKATEVYRITTHELLLLLFLLSWHKTSGENEMPLEVEKHGRVNAANNDLDLDRTIGWFTNFDLYLIRLSPDTLSNLILSLKDQIRQPVFEPFRYSVLKDITAQLPVMDQTLRFNYLGNFSSFNNQYFKISDIKSGDDIHAKNKHTCKLEFNCWVKSDELFLQLNYDTISLSSRFVDRLMEVFSELFSNFISNDLHLEVNDYLSYSDFDQTELSKNDFDNLFI